jgi:GDP-L-fucose synthase
MTEHMDKKARIFVAGHRGLVGSALVRNLEAQGFTNLITRPSNQTDLRDCAAVERFFVSAKPEYVFLAAAKVGGILANQSYPADFIRDNLQIQTNVIDGAWRHGVKKVLFLGSSCIYPRDCPQPIREEYLLTGPLEKSNEAYAIAKIAGIVMCQSYNKQYVDKAAGEPADAMGMSVATGASNATEPTSTRFISVMPTNLYGPHDNFDLATSHVLPALIRKFHEALPDQPVTVWGSGTPMREFLHADDLADACVHLMQSYDGSEIVNIGTGVDCTIRDLAESIQKVVGHTGPLVWDSTKPDGTPRKLLNVDRLHGLGWQHKIGLEAGLRQTYEWFLASNIEPRH